MDTDMDVDVDEDTDGSFGCLKRLSKSDQVLLHGIEAVVVLTLIILKQRALCRFILSLAVFLLVWG